jgi:hypothetical protein
MTSEQDITPVLLRADAALLTADAEILAGGNSSRYAHALRRAAAALEEQAARLEQGERVCRWAWDDELIGYSVSCHFRIVNGQPPRCPDCGGRVVLGDEEGGR